MELEPLVSSLLRPEAYPSGAAGPVELIQTHISYILLTPRFAYKIKKPVDFGFLDFTTLEKRLHFCTEELRLNRRLAPGVYLGVVKITEKSGEYLMEGEGGAVEYAVKMRRLPAGDMLDKRLAAGRAGAGTIRRIATVIASFHAQAETDARISAFGAPEAVGRNAAENFSQTLPFVGKGGGKTISEALFNKIKTFSDGFLKDNKNLFLERAAGGRIRDCHGDLHCEHISLGEGGDGVEIIDCIEFNERFRFSDTVSDAAFLSMDLDRRGRHDLARVFDSAYIEASEDSAGAQLLNFYRCYRAYVRGKVDSFKSAEDEVGEDERGRAGISARVHFHISGMYASGGYRPMMVVVRGLSGTGKSTIASALADRTGYFTLLSSDRIRKELAGLSTESRSPAPFEEGIYAPSFTEKTYAGLIERGKSLLGSGRPVILDATFSKTSFIERARLAALASGASFHVAECAAPDGEIRERLKKRQKGQSASDADWGVYMKQKQGFEEWDGPVIELSTTSPVPGLISGLVRKIFD